LKTKLTYINKNTYIFLKFFTNQKFLVFFILLMKRFNFLILLFTVLIALLPNRAVADIGGLTKCSESPAFAKREKASVKKLEQRMSKYEAGSPPALALQQQVERTQARFDKYSRSELLCGTDGLPHLIADGRWSHAACRCSHFILVSLQTVD